jgi:WD40 repeat protein
MGCPLAARRAKRWRTFASHATAAALGAVVGAALMFGAFRWTGGPPASSAAPLAVLRSNAGTVWGVAFGPGDRSLATTIEDGSVKVWDLETNSIRATLTGHRGSVWSAAFDHDGSLLATASDDNTVRVWDLARGEEKRQLKTDAAARVALFGDGGTVLSADRGGDVRVFDLESGEQTRGWKQPGAVYALAVSADGRTAATGGTDRAVRVWDAIKGQERMPLSGHAGPVYGLAFRPDGKVLASAGWDASIRLWDVASGELLRAIEAGRDNWAVSFAPDGKTLASAGQDGTVRVWDAETGKQLAVYRGHEGTVHSITFSRDGSRIASGSRDGTVRIWPAVRP